MSARAAAAAAAAQLRAQARAKRSQAEVLRAQATAISVACANLEIAMGECDAFVRGLIYLVQQTDITYAQMMKQVNAGIGAFTAKMQGIYDSFNDTFPLTSMGVASMTLWDVSNTQNRYAEIKRGDTGEMVSRVQAKLVISGHLDAAHFVFGKYDKHTEQAIKAFAASAGLGNNVTKVDNDVFRMLGFPMETTISAKTPPSVEAQLGTTYATDQLKILLNIEQPVPLNKSRWQENDSQYFFSYGMYTTRYAADRTISDLSVNKELFKIAGKLGDEAISIYESFDEAAQISGGFIPYTVAGAGVIFLIKTNDQSVGITDASENLANSIYDQKIEAAKNYAEKLNELPTKYLISKEMLSNIDYVRINRGYINDLGQIVRDLQNTNFLDSDEYDAQAVKNSSVDYIEMLIICSIDEEIADFVEESAVVK